MRRHYEAASVARVVHPAFLSGLFLPIINRWLFSRLATNAAFFHERVEGKMCSNPLDVFVKRSLEFNEDHRLFFLIASGRQTPTQPADCILNSTHGRYCIWRHSSATSE
jgi:hypothetical protein